MSLVVNHFQNSSPNECVYCERPNPEISVFGNPKSKEAHRACFDIIRVAEKALLDNIEISHPDKKSFGVAYGRAVEAVRIKCEPKTIISYCNSYGQAKLAEIYNINGLHASRGYYSRAKL